MPDERLNPQQNRQKAELNARIEGLSKSYGATEKQLDDKKSANVKQARQLADAFLGCLRKHGQVRDVSDHVKIDDSAKKRLADNGIDEGTVHHWVNEFHSQTIWRALSRSYGSRGRPLDGGFSPRDLAVALDSRDMKPFEPVEIGL